MTALFVVRLQQTLNSELIKLSQWFLANKLSLNAGKTNYMIFGFKVNVGASSNFSLRIDGNEIKRVYCTKFLGVHVDSSLNWKTHAYQISLKVSKTLGVGYLIV